MRKQFLYNTTSKIYFSFTRNYRVITKKNTFFTVDRNTGIGNILYSTSLLHYNVTY